MFDTDANTDNSVSSPQRRDEDGDEDKESTSVLGEMVGEKSHLLGLPMPDGPLGTDEDGERNGDRKLAWWDVWNVRGSIEMVPSFIWRGMWKRAVKSCILVAKVSVFFFSLFCILFSFLFHMQVSTMTSMYPLSASTQTSALTRGGPNLAVSSVLLFAAVLDTLMDGLWVSVVLAVFHVAVVLLCCHADLGRRCCR